MFPSLQPQDANDTLIGKQKWLQCIFPCFLSTETGKAWEGDTISIASVAGSYTIWTGRKRLEGNGQVEKKKNIFQKSASG